MTVVADTGAVYALVDADDDWHERVVSWWKKRGADAVVPVVVLPEICYLLHVRIGIAAEQAFVDAAGRGEFALDPFADEDLARAGELMREYADLPLGFVDATVAATAERLETREIVTTDRRHFGILKPRRARSFILYP